MKYLENYFEQSAHTHPDQPAVDDDGRQTSYKELDERANKIGQFLVTMGVERNDRVCFLTSKSGVAYAAVLGILKSGACWVPLATSMPSQRLRRLVETNAPRAIICESDTEKEVLAARDAAAPNAIVLVMGDAPSSGVSGVYTEAALVDLPSTKPEISPRSPDDLAYIIFTSGSTGIPKGVMVQHRNICQFIDLCPELFPVEDGLRFAHHSDLVFDPSLFDLFYCWATRGVLVPFNKAEYRINPTLFLEEGRPNVWFSVPSAIAAIADAKGLSNPAVQHLKCLILGGEMLTGGLVKSWYDTVSELKIYNVYGTTETAIISHKYEIPRDFDPEKPIPVGGLLPGFDVRLMDGDEIVSPGEVGECVLYGSQLCPGYWDNEPETSTRFVRFPLDPRLPQVWYRTGDLLRLNEDGLFIYVGRVDNQVKIRGHRVEIEEVEQAFASHTSVAEIAVVALKIENAPHEARLVAFVGCRDEVDEDELRAHVATALPRHMVPTRIFTSRLMLPRNNNGKIDRQALRNRAADN